MSIVDSLPPIPKDDVSGEGRKFTIVEARVRENIQTSMGLVKRALILDGRLAGDKETYSQMFSIDKDPIAGSAGRILSKTEIKNISELNDRVLAKMKGLELLVKNKGGKLYWY